MRGRIPLQQPMFVAIELNTLVDRILSKDHPLRIIKKVADTLLVEMSDSLDSFYADTGPESIPPESILKALLYRALYSIRSERQLEEVLTFDLRCRWFVGLPLDKSAWDHSTFSKLRERMLLDEIVLEFFEKVVAFLRNKNLVSNEHFSVDGTLLQAWASHKSVVKKKDLDKDGKPPKAPPGGRNAWIDFKGQKRSNKTHVSATDPDSRFASKGTGAKLCHELNIVTENRNALIVDLTVNPPTGTSEKEAALAMASRQRAKGHPFSTLGADKKYSDGDDLVIGLDQLGVEPHFAIRDDRPNALARLFELNEGYPISRRCRMRIEEAFGYLKTICLLAQVKFRGTWNVFIQTTLGACAYNLRRYASLALKA